MSALPKWKPPPLPSNKVHRNTPPGVILPFPTNNFYKKVAKRLLRRLLPPPIQVVLEILDWMYPNPKTVVTPVGWQVHCQRTTQCPNTPGIRPCAQTWGPGCVGSGACTCANVGQSFPGSSQNGTRKQTWIYELSPLSVCNRMIYHAFMPACPADGIKYSPHLAKPRLAPPSARRSPGFWPQALPRNPSRIPNRYVPPNPNWKPDPGRKDLPEHQPPPDEAEPPPPPPTGKPPRPERPINVPMPYRPEIDTPEWVGPLPWEIPQLIPPLAPGFDEPQPVPFEQIPNRPDWLPFPPGEVSVRGPGGLPGPSSAPGTGWTWWPGRGFFPSPVRDPNPFPPPPNARRLPRVQTKPPTGNRPPETRPGEAPPIIRGPVTDRLPGVSVRMEPPGPPVRRPSRPIGRKKEVKGILAIRAGSGIGRGINAVTEAGDLIECLHKGLPKRLQSKPKWHKSDAPGGWTRNKGISLKTKAHDLYKAVDSRLTPEEAGKALMDAFNACMENWVQDRLIGGIGNAMARASRRNGLPRGLEIGGAARRRAGQADWLPQFQNPIGGL